jgi:ribosomal protein L37E
MADVAPNYEGRQEFWKPIVTSHTEAARTESQTHNHCRKCGAEAVLVGQFCHVCGTDRAADSPARLTRGLASWVDFVSVREALGLGTPSLVAFFLGCGCLVAVLIIGLTFTASTVLEWQAIQLWRIEWLLAAIALFGVGLLLKKTK